MTGDLQLCWVDKGGKDRELELWLGTRKICGFKDICEMELLEEILHISGNDIETVTDDEGNTFQNLHEKIDELESKIENAKMELD